MKNSGKYGGVVKPEDSRGKNKEINRQGPGSGAGEGTYGSGKQYGFGNGEDGMPAASANGTKIGMRWPSEDFKKTLRGGVSYMGDLADAQKKVEAIFESDSE